MRNIGGSLFRGPARLGHRLVCDLRVPIGVNCELLHHDRCAHLVVNLVCDNVPLQCTPRRCANVTFRIFCNEDMTFCTDSTAAMRLPTSQQATKNCRKGLASGPMLAGAVVASLGFVGSRLPEQLCDGGDTIRLGMRRLESKHQHDVGRRPRRCHLSRSCWITSGTVASLRFSHTISHGRKDSTMM